MIPTMKGRQAGGLHEPRRPDGPQHGEVTHRQIQDITQNGPVVPVMMG
jgi:hypothetical protein